MLPSIANEAAASFAASGTGIDDVYQPLPLQDTESGGSQRHTTYSVAYKTCGREINNDQQERHTHTCTVCGKEFTRKDNLRIHQRTHSHQRPYQCEECSESFTRSDLLSDHVRLHRGEFFTCSDCGKMFTRAERLRSHASVCSVEKIKCPQCGRCFTRINSLQAHMKTHGVDDSADLDFIGDLTPDVSDVNKNKVRSGCVRQPRRPYMCFTCNRTFPLACRLRAHLQVHSGEKNFTCAVCGRQFAAAYQLCLHMRTHTGERPYECHMCGKSFARTHNLKQHMRSHTGEKPYGCDVCGKSYTQTKTLKEHMRMHTGERPFECLTCNKRFTRIDNLKVHELTHTDNKRHVCSTCGKKYADARCFQKHVNAHTQSAPVRCVTSYKCGICEMACQDLRSLRAHSRLHHRRAVETPAADQSYFCGQCGRELTVQMSNRQEIVLSANCDCSGEVDDDGKVDDVLREGVDVTELDTAHADEVQLPD